MGLGVIVAGGSGALGRSVVQELASRGWNVAVVDLAPAALEGAAQVSIGGVDLADEAAVTRAYQDAAERLGGLAGLVNVAGGFIWEPLENGSMGSWDRMYRMNLRTAAVSARAALPHLLRNGGAIVNVGAAAANQAMMGMAPYASSKAGVRALTESLADEFKARGIRVNAVLPTIIDTPANRRDMPDADPSAWVRPEAAARVIAFLLSQESACMTGCNLQLSLHG